jgi:hypothetical protein
MDWAYLAGALALYAARIARFAVVVPWFDGVLSGPIGYVIQIKEQNVLCKDND